MSGRVGKSQGTIRRAIELCSFIGYLPAGEFRHICAADVREIVGAQKEEKLSAINVLDSICEEVERISSGWLFAFTDPAKAHSGNLVVVNMFTRNKDSRTPGKKSSWKTFENRNPTPPERKKLAKMLALETFAVLSRSESKA